MIPTFVSYQNFTREYGRPAPPINTEDIRPTATMEEETRYFLQNIGAVSTGAELVENDRLFRYVTTAFGLQDQAGNKELIANVLDEGLYDPYVRFSFAQRQSGEGANPIDEAAKAFWFDNAYAFDELIADKLAGVVQKYATRTGAAADPAEMAYFVQTASRARNGEQLVQDERVYVFLLQAFGMEQEYGNRELIAKAIDAGTYNPLAKKVNEDSLANTMPDSRFKALASAFGFAEVGDLNVRNPEFIEKIAEQYTIEAVKADARAASGDNVRSSAIPGSIQRDIDYFRERIGTISTVDDLMADSRAYRFVLTAFDLESQIPYKGLIKKVLKDGVSDPLALANKLVDRKFYSFAASMGFAEVGDRNIRNPNFVEQIVDKFLRVKLESTAGESNVGVRLAAYFDRQGPRLTNWYAVLADKALREVVFTAFDFPDEMNASNPDRLVEILKDRYDIEDFQDPEKRAEFIKRFAVLYDVKYGTGETESARTALFAPLGGRTRGQIITIDPGTLGAIRMAR